MRVTTVGGKEFLEDWVLALQKLLGWDRKRALTWAEKYELDLNDEMSSLWREHPVFYIGLFLVPASAKDKVNDLDRVTLARRLEAAIRLPDCGAGPLERCNWEAAIARIDAILAEYGESLANVRRQYDE